MSDQKLDVGSSEGRACPLFPSLSSGVYCTCGKACAFFVVQRGNCALVDYLTSTAKLARGMVADRIRAAQGMTETQREVERICGEQSGLAKAIMRGLVERGEASEEK